MANRIDPVVPDPCEAMPFCPVCGGRMEIVYDRPHQKVCVCADCMSGLTVPQSAWQIAKTKKEINLGK